MSELSLLQVSLAPRNKMLKLFFKFFAPRKISEEELIKETSKELVNFVVSSAFKVFKDEEFRKQFNFSEQENIEQDRLFNELSLTSICLLLLLLDTASDWWQNEKRYFWQKVKSRIAERFQEWLKELGISQKYVSFWGKLIKMRYNEYKRDLPKLYQASGIVDPEFIKSDDERRKVGYVRFMAVSIGAIHHLRKGKANPKDPFFKELRTWLEVLNSQLEEKIVRK